MNGLRGMSFPPPSHPFLGLDLDFKKPLVLEPLPIWPARQLFKLLVIIITRSTGQTNDDDIAYLAYLRRQELDKQARIEELAQKALKEMQEKRRKQKVKF